MVTLIQVTYFSPFRTKTNCVNSVLYTVFQGHSRSVFLHWIITLSKLNGWKISIIYLKYHQISVERICMKTLFIINQNYINLFSYCSVGFDSYSSVYYANWLDCHEFSGNIVCTWLLVTATQWIVYISEVE